MSKGEQVWHLTGAYYSVLNEDDGFRRELADMVRRLEALGVAPSDRLWGEAQHGDPVWLEELARTYAGSPQGRYYEAAGTLRKEVDAFVARWPLPARIWEDLRYSYDLYLEWGKARGRAPRLELGGFGEAQPMPGLPAVVDVREVDGMKVRIEENQPWILPPHPLPFLYDPLSHDRAWLHKQIEAICKAIRGNILAQARLYEEEVEAQGWGNVPPRWNPATVRKAMERLYLRAVRRLSWGQIAYRTGCSTVLARRQVYSYARLVGVPLPEGSSP